MKNIILVSGFLLTIVLYSFAGWQIETVVSDGDVGQFNSLALDSSNNPNISYYDNTSHVLKYARYNGSICLISTVDNNADCGSFSSIALDSNDTGAV